MTTLSLVLELDPDRIAGRLVSRTGHETRFSGWLEFIDALEAQLGAASESERTTNASRK